jgi:hypothetical protein
LKLDRNAAGNAGRGKYALLLLRKLTADIPKEVILDWGTRGSESEFFVMRLKDRYAQSGLWNYANVAEHEGNQEWAEEVFEMANRSGPSNRWCKVPD